MGTIPSYPHPSRPLDGGELLAAWQDGAVVSLSIAALMGFGGPASAGHYRYGGFAVAGIGGGEVLLDHAVAQAHTLAAQLAGCVASAGTPPAQAWVATVALNDSIVGAITLYPDGSAATSTVRGRVLVDVGDVVTVTAPETADPSIARVRFTFSGVAD